MDGWIECVRWTYPFSKDPCSWQGLQGGSEGLGLGLHGMLPDGKGS